MPISLIAQDGKNAAHEFKSLNDCPFVNKKSRAYVTWARSWYNQLLATQLFASEENITSLTEKTSEVFNKSFPESGSLNSFLAELKVLIDYAQNDALPLH
jgi:hypothetical protein